MKTVILVIALCAIVATAQPTATTPPRPNIPETFEAEVDVEIHENSTHAFGEGLWAIDTSAGMAVEMWEFKEPQHQHLGVYELGRWDLKMAYEIVSTNKTECKKQALSGSMPAIWGWVAQATFAGTKDIRHKTYDLWSYSASGSTVELAVQQGDANEPVLMGSKNAAGDEVLIYFRKFKAETPKSKDFDVPSECM